jgi:uncharacterized membrane protein YjdF
MFATRLTRESTAGIPRAASRAYFAVAVAGTLPLVALPLVALPEQAKYRYAALFLVPFLWGVFAFRRPLHLHPFHFALLALALALHGLGALGFYAREFHGLAFDTYVHAFFGLVGALLLERAFRLGRALHGAGLWIATLLFVLGLGAVHELGELATTLALGQEMGMYHRGNADDLDTHKDLANNGLGALVGLGASAAWRRHAARQSARR